MAPSPGNRAVLGWAGEILDGSDPALTLAVPCPPPPLPLQELELVEDVWRGEAQDLLSQIAQLQEENKQLMSNLNHKDVGFSEEEFQKQEGEAPRPGDPHDHSGCCLCSGAERPRAGWESRVDSQITDADVDVQITDVDMNSVHSQVM